MSISFTFKIKAACPCQWKYDRLVSGNLLFLKFLWNCFEILQITWRPHSLSPRSLSPRSPLSFRMTACGVEATLSAASVRTDLQKLPSVTSRTWRKNRGGLRSARGAVPLPASSLVSTGWIVRPTGASCGRSDLASSTSSHLKCLLSSPVTSAPGRLTDWILSQKHIRYIYKRRQREKKCACARHVSVEHFEETYFARRHLHVAAHRSVGNFVLLPLLTPLVVHQPHQHRLLSIWRQNVEY